MARLLSVLLVLLASAWPAAGQDAFDNALSGLAGGFNQQVEAVERLGALGDPRAVPVLRALADGRLLKRPDGNGVVSPGEAVPPGAEPVRVNNRVRVALRGALGRLQLVSPEPNERLAAAEAVFRSRDAANAPLLEAALARESVPRIRAQMELSLAASRLVAADDNAKRAAISALGATASTDARGLLLEARAANPGLLAEIEAAVAAIDRRLSLRRMAETLFQGLSLGSVLLLAALGLAVTFGVMGVINMAHGEMVMILSLIHI